MAEIVVKLENISKFYKLYHSPKDRLKEALHPFRKKLHKEFYALKNVNLEIKKGEILGIVGRNGSGKSTMLKIISGVIQPSSGKIITNGNVSALLELGSGLHPEFTGMQNIYFSGTMMGFSREEMEEKIDDIVAFAEIGNFIQQPLKTYSNGMKARLGFALAINMDPKILILDEVLSVGDELFRRKCHARMEEFFKSDCTVLYVSHSVPTINEICTRAIFLDEGEQILEGPPKFVTMYYQKFLYAKPGDKNKIKNKIIQMNKFEDKKKFFVEKLEVKKVEGKRENKKEDSRKEEKTESGQISYFLQDFKPKSTVVQKNYPVDITDIEIKTLDGKPANVLVMDESYIYSYKVQFNTDMEKIFFTMAMKNAKGVNISSAKTLDKDMIEKVKKGSTYLVKWKFHCSLLPDTYYTNVCVFSISPKYETVILNRIVDAIAFKVQQIPDLMYTGIVNLSQDFQVELLN